MEAWLASCVSRSLSLHCVRNATFLAERLCASFPNEPNFQLLASCYLRANKPLLARHVLKGLPSDQSRYLLALACYDLQLLTEAEAALQPNLASMILPPALHSLIASSSPASSPSAASAQRSHEVSDLGTCFLETLAHPQVPNGAAGLYLLGLICKATNRRQVAIRHFTSALALDPFFWSAYEELCILGAEAEASQAFNETAALHMEQQQQRVQQEVSVQQQQHQQPQHCSQPQQQQSGQGQEQGQEGVAPPQQQPAQQGLNPASNYVTPPEAVVSAWKDTASPRTPAGPVAPAVSAATRMAHRRKMVDENRLRNSPLSSHSLFTIPSSLPSNFPSATPHATADLPGATPQDWEPKQVAREDDKEARQRQQPGREKAGGGSHTSNGAASSADSAAGGMAGGGAGAGDEVEGRGALGRGSSGAEGGGREGEGGDEAESGQGGAKSGGGGGYGEAGEDGSAGGGTGKGGESGALLAVRLLKQVGRAFLLLCMMRCQEAIEAFSELPAAQYNTHWVLVQVGRAYVDMVQYAEAERVFEMARQASPCHVDGLDIYSTVLFHLRKDVQLSLLAQEAIAVDRMAPQAWCVSGNLMSLTKQHEAALKFFRRATQLDPSFTYAHTLCGHEYAAMEELEDAALCFRTAIRLDARHYNAWYGLGSVLMRQERFHLAEHHLRTALTVNPHSSVLHTYLGVCLHSLKRSSDARASLQHAMRLDPRNPLPVFQHAYMLLGDERLGDALHAAKQLLHVAAREPSVYFLLGKICKKLDRPEEALMHLNFALDLKPPAQQVNLIKAFIEKLNVPDNLEDVEEEESM
ncbi:unnamed protein product [Closterium sp. Yama58-4]|nr:unnamed protein product [Closterium sp. Yama58-4]